MNRSGRQQLRQLSETVGQWAAVARDLIRDREAVEAAAAAADTQLRRRTITAGIGSARCTFVVLGEPDLDLLGDLRRSNELSRPTPSFMEGLRRFPDEADRARREVRAAFGLKRLLASSHARSEAEQAEARLRKMSDWAQSIDLPRVMKGLGPPVVPRPALGEVLDRRFGLRPHLLVGGNTLAMLSGRLIRELPDVVATVNRAEQVETQLRQEVLRAGELVRRSETTRMLVDMPLERLKEVTNDRLRLGPLQQLGWTSVGQVLGRETQLGLIPGIGEVTAARIAGAAHTLLQTTYDEMPVRLDIKRRSAEATALLRSLRRYDSFRTAMPTLDADRQLAHDLKPIAEAISRGGTHVAIAVEDDETLSHVGKTLEDLSSRTTAYHPATNIPSDDPWDDFLERAAVYFTLLVQLGLTTEDEEKAHGDLPQEILDAVRELELKTDLLKVSLRGYQSFAARFALVQKRVIIGDEMGLGKTVEALAVLAHLRARGRTHFLVVCPAAVVTNWVREVESKSDLRAHRLHGYEREHGARSWQRGGGVAITTYDSLGWYLAQMQNQEIECLILDEAHAIKNPRAQRSVRSSTLISSSPLAVLMTGTPLENRADEFRQLVAYVRADLASSTTDRARQFRHDVAPAYLRRNLEDVLNELPEKIEVEEWLPMSGPDLTIYRDALAAGNFMALRQAAMLAGGDSEKVKRLLEIVQEAEENQRKVIIYSYFRDVLGRVASTLPGPVHGPMTGSVPAHTRQTMVDDFTRAKGGAVLVSQIQSGGVGLNIQAASVVVICEPQLKPSLEEQAIARAHRMGQVQRVQVHRLLSEEGVDARLVELLAEKRRLFDEFARHSETARGAPEAFDLSEAELARKIIAEERQRLAGEDVTGRLAAQS